MSVRQYLRVIQARFNEYTPLYANFGVTLRCNLNCRMCNTMHREDRGELSLEQIDRLTDGLKDMGIVFIGIGGGEPLMRADIGEVVRLMSKKGFRTHLLTNGTMLDKDRLSGLLAAGLDAVSLSLHSLDPRKQEYICGRAGYSQGIMKTFQDLSGILSEQGKLLLVNTVVSRLNIDEVPELIRFMEEQGNAISLIPIARGSPAEFVFGDRDRPAIDAVYEEILAMKRNGSRALFNSTLFLQWSKRYLKGEPCRWRCDAGKRYFLVDHVGRMLFCHAAAPETVPPGRGFMAHIKTEEYRRRCNAFIENCSGCMHPCWADISFILRDRASLWGMAITELTRIMKKWKV